MSKTATVTIACIACCLAVGCVIDLPDRRLVDAGIDARLDLPVADLRKDASHEADGSLSCGNTVLDPGETCDSAIGSGEIGACPTSCDDREPCTADTLEAAGTCRARCTRKLINVCVDGDGCCPALCTDQTDNDCPSTCGNGRLDLDETCEGEGCPTSCPPAPCRSGQIVGSPQNCMARCLFINLPDKTPCKQNGKDGLCRVGACCGLSEPNC